MKTYSLKSVSEKLNKWVKPTLKILNDAGIKPIYEMKQGDRIHRVYDKKAIDTFVARINAEQEARAEKSRIAAAGKKPAITPPTPAANGDGLAEAVRKLTQHIIDLELVIAANTKAVHEANQLTLEQLTHPVDDK